MACSMSWRALGASMALCSLFLVACSADASGDDDDDPEATPESSTEDALTGSKKSVKLLYEGTCAFLHNCSSYSRRLPVGQVQWGCGGTTCSDSERWMAGPSRSYCGKSVKVCKGGTCTTGVVRDISNVHGWEASNGLMDALDMNHTVNVNACSGSGGGSVTVQVL